MNISLLYSKIKKISTIRIVTALIFAALTFTFVHSEFGLLDYDGDNHSAHDYCTIVQHATSHTSNITKSDVIKLKIEKASLINFGKILRSPSLLDFPLDSEHFHLQQKTARVYLFDCAFLI